jgi:hypothetical protein
MVLEISFSLYRALAIGNLKQRNDFVEASIDERKFLFRIIGTEIYMFVVASLKLQPLVYELLPWLRVFTMCVTLISIVSFKVPWGLYIGRIEIKHQY